MTDKNNINFTENETIPDVFFKIAKMRGRETVLVYKKGQKYQEMSFNELADKVKTFALYLQNEGLIRGDRVAIFSENSPEWVIADLAIMKAGGIVVPIHTTLNEQTIHYIIEHSGTRFLCVSKNKKCIVRGIRIISLSDVPDTANSFLPDTLSNFSEVKHTDTASIIYTSGTTSTPKGVELTHSNFLADVLATHEAIPVIKGDVFLSFLPLSHALERTAGYYMPLLLGGSIAYAENFDHIGQNILEVKPTVIIAVPRFF